MNGLRLYARRWSALGRDARLMLTYRALASLSIAPFNLFFSLYVLSLGYQPDFLGLLMGVSAFPALILAVPIGLAARRWGARRTVMIGIVGIAAGLAAVCLSTGPTALLVTRAILGGLSLLPEVVIFPLLAGSSRPEERATLFSADHSVMILSDLAGNMIAGFLPGVAAIVLGAVPESAGAYRAAMLAGTAVYLSAIIPISLLAERRALPSGSYANPLALVRQLPQWGKLVVPNVIFSIGAAFFLPFINVYFRQTFQVSDTTLGFLFAMMSLVAGTAGLAAPFAAERFGQLRAIILLQVISLPFMVGMGLARWLPFAAACFWLRAGFCKTGDPLYNSFMMDQVSDADRPLMNSLSTLSHRVGSTFVPFLSGLVQMNYGFAPVFFGATAIYFLASASIYVLFARQRQGVSITHVSSADAPSPVRGEGPGRR